ncbi:unnamed protein product [Euphydryas editha]|uniref:Uncharacterized protein n=1 Tax=Euphydryas editha TaxID=104508 RepID=A0AAU9VAM3_EUPED|nr:unnamed protein product [Euphydryas editha]
MISRIFLIVLFLNPVMLKPRYVELDEDEQQLFRAAYDTPAYNHDEYQEDEDMKLGKLDLLKDGLWVVKAKIKELKAFNKALAANLLSTKMKVKELLAQHSHVKKHQHETPEKNKIIHNYQPQPHPMYEPQIPQNGAHQFEHDPYYGY